MEINGRRIVGFITLGIGVLLTALLIKTMWFEVPLWIFGHKATATLEETWWENYDLEDLSSDFYDIEYYFSYQFTTPDGEVVQGVSRVTEDEFMGYRPGGDIMVKYSPLNPSNSRLDDSRLMPFLLFSYVPFILICLFTLAAGREMVDF